ncbi:MAG: cyclic-di-AMP receptor [Oscillospiraceae bacterium]|nr:cyclic-di-AMP receptor [Oscillospiraceae bacterium]
MKLVVAIVSGEDSSKVSGALTKEGFFVTKLATSGGFLAAGNTTFIVGTEDEKVPSLIEILKSNCSTRKQTKPSTGSLGLGMFSAAPIEVQLGGATVFVLDIEQFHKL